MESCWLSPQGKVYECHYHADAAREIVKELGLWEEYWENIEKYSYSAEEFLEFRGWVKYSDLGRCFKGWCIFPYTTLTQNQIDKIYELTGDFFGTDP